MGEEGVSEESNGRAVLEHESRRTEESNLMRTTFTTMLTVRGSKFSCHGYIGKGPVKLEEMFRMLDITYLPLRNCASRHL